MVHVLRKYPVNYGKLRFARPETGGCIELHAPDLRPGRTNNV